MLCISSSCHRWFARICRYQRVLHGVLCTRIILHIRGALVSNVGSTFSQSSAPLETFHAITVQPTHWMSGITSDDSDRNSNQIMQTPKVYDFTKTEFNENPDALDRDDFSEIIFRPGHDRNDHSQDIELVNMTAFPGFSTWLFKNMYIIRINLYISERHSSLRSHSSLTKSDKI